MKRVNQKGYTLVEVILALAILGILAAAFLPAFQSAFLWIVNAGDRSEVIHEAQDLSESVIQEGIEILPDETEQIQFVFTNPDDHSTVIVDLDGYYVAYEPIELFIPVSNDVVQ